MSYYIFNGQLIPAEEAKISIADQGYFFDLAVYSSLKVIQGKLFFPEYQVERLFESARLIGIEHRLTKGKVLKWLGDLVRANQLDDALLRIIFIGDADGGTEVKLYIFPLGLTYYPRQLYKKGVKVITYPGERRLPQAKSKDLLLHFLALREAKRAGAIEALLVDSEGHIREGTRSNFFAIKDGVLITPPPEKVLEGITKKIILQICRQDFKIKHADIPLANLPEYEEFFITSTSMNILPIRQIDDLKLSTDFPKTKLLQRLFQEYYRRKVLAG